MDYYNFRDSDGRDIPRNDWKNWYIPAKDLEDFNKWVKLEAPFEIGQKVKITGKYSGSYHKNRFGTIVGVYKDYVWLIFAKIKNSSTSVYGEIFYYGNIEHYDWTDEEVEAST